MRPVRRSGKLLILALVKIREIGGKRNFSEWESGSFQYFPSEWE